MISIQELEVQLINDQFGILPGNRYEFLFDLEVPEDDELYIETGVSVRVLFLVDGDKKDILKYELVDRAENKVLDFDLEDEELAMIKELCEKNYQHAE